MQIVILIIKFREMGGRGGLEEGCRGMERKSKEEVILGVFWLCMQVQIGMCVKVAVLFFSLCVNLLHLIAVLSHPHTTPHALNCIFWMLISMLRVSLLLSILLNS